ncbi:MAG: glycosyltransferase family 4 protein [Planctomycetia bacterium]|nr:glycosyltransferase family 4 protein [Planctomycetia bacterium]
MSHVAEALEEDLSPSVAATEACDVDAERVSARRTRVAYLVNQYPQPSHSFIRREIRALEDQGYEVRRFTVRSYAGKLVDEQDRAERNRTTALLDVGVLRMLAAVLQVFVASPRVFVRALKLAIRLGKRSDRGRLLNLVYFAEACVLRKLLQAGGIEHVHAHFGTNSTSVAMLCRELGGPAYSFTVHGPEEFDKPEFLHLGEKIERSAFVVAISEYGRSQLYRQCSYEHWAKIQVVRCGVDAQFHDVAPTPPAAAARLVCVARLHEQKGLPMLVDAAARLKREGLTFQIDVIGDGPLRSGLEAKIAEFGLENFVRLLGWKSGAEVREALLASRALVLPSFAEGLPVVIMEALALHRPVVSTYVAGIPELVEPGINGWLVPAGAIEPLVEAMREVLAASVEELALMGADGARRTSERHHASTEAARLARLIEQTR